MASNCGAQWRRTGASAYIGAAPALLARLVQADRRGSAAPGLYQPGPVKRSLSIIVAGDRGMTGAYNANVLRCARQPFEPD